MHVVFNRPRDRLGLLRRACFCPLNDIGFWVFLMFSFGKVLVALKTNLRIFFFTIGFPLIPKHSADSLTLWAKYSVTFGETFVDESGGQVGGIDGIVSNFLVSFWDFVDGRESGLWSYGPGKNRRREWIIAIFGNTKVDETNFLQEWMHFHYAGHVAPQHSAAGYFSQISM